MAEQIATFGDLSKGLAAYNAGPGAVRKAGNAIPNFPETQKYVAAVMRNAGYPMAPPKLADGGLIELARKYADGGSVAGAAQVYDPAVIAAIAASITEPQGYADGGTATGISSDDAAPAQERVQEQRPAPCGPCSALRCGRCNADGGHPWTTSLWALACYET